MSVKKSASQPGASVVPEWVKGLRAEGSARLEAERLSQITGVDIKECSVYYWRRRSRMFSRRPIFTNVLLWPVLRDAILDAVTSWAPTPWREIFPEVIDTYGKVSEGTLREALRMLVEDGELTFTPPGREDGENTSGGYTRARCAIRCPVDIEPPPELTKHERWKLIRAFGRDAVA